MGQKTHPRGFRLGVTETWDSRWFAGKNYADLLQQDLAIRKFLRKRLSHAGVPKIEIERTRDEVKVILFTARELEPYRLYERTAQEFKIDRHAVSFEDMTNITEKVFFQPSVSE